jgi:hypothetical protein
MRLHRKLERDERTWLSFRCRAHSSEPILALRAPRVRVAGGAVGEDSALFDASPALADFTSDDLVWLSGTGAEPPAAAASAERWPRFGGPLGCEDGPGSARERRASACCEWTGDCCFERGKGNPEGPPAGALLVWG